MYKNIYKCRICGNKDLRLILDLGIQKLTGVFPKSKSQLITEGPVELVRCDGQNSCKLIQLRQSYDFNEMYGDNYGYRSGLNLSMVIHLREKVKKLEAVVPLVKDDLILDIGSNDGTTLSFYSNEYDLVGIDPSGKKFIDYYPSHVRLLNEFFSARVLKKYDINKKAKIVTSFSMFYDLEDPVQFAKDVCQVLHDDGVWCFEQSYVLSMFKNISFDTICQEHLEYYSLHQIHLILDAAGMKLMDIDFNNVNGGSFSVIAVKSKSNATIDVRYINKCLSDEYEILYATDDLYRHFVKGIEESKTRCLEFLESAKCQNLRVIGLGASTKGNVLLQYYGINSDLIEFIGEINNDKIGKFTPGSNIEIISEDQALGLCADFYLVLPWHFRDFFVNNIKFKGKKLIFPLPRFEVYEVV